MPNDISQSLQDIAPDIPRRNVEAKKTNVTQVISSINQIPQSLPDLTKHSRQLLKCTYCELTFYSKSQLKEHITVHHAQRMFSCDRCGIFLKSTQELNIHKERIHCDSLLERTEPIDLANRDESIAKCSFYQTLALPGTDITEGLPQLLECGAESFGCVICGAMFSSKAIMNDHRKGMHENRTYACNCGEVFRWRTSLKNHTRRCMFASKQDEQMD